VNSRLQELYDNIENQKTAVFDLIAGLSDEQLNQQPPTGKWSISQIISHLIVAERLSLNYVQKKIQGVDKLKDSGLAEELKMIVLKVSQRIEGIKFKAPQHVVDHTIVYSNVEELKSEWMKTRKDFRQLLEQIDDKHLKRKIYKHAVAGYLNIQHAVMFFREHATHHIPQIRKLVKTLK
jgi:uncharacterized damage-inducible protein DinB